MGLFDILKKKDVSSVNTQVTVNQPTNRSTKSSCSTTYSDRL